MSYLVLARKWRPKRFAELVGQEHVVRALTNALESGRVHHAYLFSGTRGVGKTTIARIFAKSLNCERGTGADPCGECETCKAIDAGRYIDLLEIDAASNTGVDNVRELIDNAQYMPSRGRYKVYLIDEVHMLSKQAFNALLKTLEEPPEHVKFLFATTDPEKLLVTVLSRCLQFNLKRLDEEQIGGQITRILAAEGIAADPGAVRQLCKAADGSLRDGLSLLDQAIAYTGANTGAGSLTDEAVASMLGTVDRTRVGALLAALAEGDGEALLGEVARLADVSPDWSGVLDALAEALHRVQVRQLVPGSHVEADGVDVDTLSAQLRPEVVQLWYQMSLAGRRDLHLAPSPRAGFEMSVLRMLAFRPAPSEARAPVSESSKESGRAAAAAARAALEPRGARSVSAREDAGVAAPPPVSAGSAKVPVDTSVAAPTARAMREAPPASPSALKPSASVTPAPLRRAAEPDGPDAPEQPVAPLQSEPLPQPPGTALHVDADGWLDIVDGLDLRGPVKELAGHAAFVDWSEGVLRLALPASDDHLKAPFLVSQFAIALAAPLGAQPQIRFDAADANAETLHSRRERQADVRQTSAEHAFLADPHVKRLMSKQGATLVADSIRPHEE